MNSDDVYMVIALLLLVVVALSLRSSGSGTGGDSGSPNGTAPSSSRQADSVSVGSLRIAEGTRRASSERAPRRRKARGRASRSAPAGWQGSFGDWQEESPLVRLGYRVGKTHGLPVRQRREILDTAMNIDIPSDFPADYRIKWGEGETAKRAQAIIDFLGAQADLRSTLPSHRQAVDDWQSDREWFYQKYRGRFPRLRKP